MNPFIAFFNEIRELLITTNNLLNLAISYTKTVLIEDISPYLSVLNKSFLPCDFSNKAGKFFLISFALSLTISSGVLIPIAPPILG